MAKLKIVAGENIGKEYKLDEGETIIGRRSTSTIVVDNGKTSRDHAKISFKEDYYTINDLNSSNGTYLNGFAIEDEEILEAGDEIQVGGIKFRLFLEEKSPNEIKIPGYIVEDTIAQGGMGTVYRAIQISMDRPVAIKVLHDKYAIQRDWVDKFIQEARLAGKLNHPNIIGVHDVGKSGSTYYITMELIEGNDISKIMRYRSLEYPEIMKIGAKIADALAYAHKNKLIHRDIKPENIMLSNNGEAKLADLGIAKSFEAGRATSIENSKKVLGTPHYMSPEQASGEKLDGKSDLYSLGATLYHMLAGEPPFDGENNTEIMTKHLTDEPESLLEKKPRLPKAVIDAVDKLMKKSPGDRFANAEEASKALEKAAKAKARLAPQKSRNSNKAKETNGAGHKTTMTKRATTRKNNTKKQVGFFLTVLIIVLIVFKVVGKKDKITTDKGPSVTEIINEAKALDSNGKHGEAIAKYRSIKNIFPKNLDAQLQANNAIEKIEETTEALMRKKDADNKWKIFNKWEMKNIDNLDEMETRLREIIANEPLLKSKAARKLQGILKIKNKIQADEMKKEINAAKTKAEAGVITFKIDSAINALSAFQKKYPYSKYDSEIQPLLDKLNTAVEEKYNKTKRMAKDYYNKKNYAQAIGMYKEFINDVESEKFNQKAKMAINTIKSELSVIKEQLTPKVQEEIKKLNYDAALNILAETELQLNGTDFGKNIPRQKKSVNILRSYHKFIIDEINKAGVKDTNIRINCYLNGKESLKIIRADRRGFTTPLTGSATTVIKWTKATPLELSKIYKCYTPKNNKQWQKALNLYCQLFKLPKQKGAIYGNN